MKKLIQLAFVTLFTTTCFSQKIAYIKQNEVLKVLPNYLANVKLVDSLSKQYAEEIKIKTNGLQTKIATLLKPYDVKEGDTVDKMKAAMSDSDKAKFDLLVEENKLIDTKVKSYELEVQTKFNKDVQPLLDNLNTIIKNYTKANNIDAVYIFENIRSAMAYLDESKDITNEIIKKIK